MTANVATDAAPSMWAKAKALDALQWRCLILSLVLLPLIDVGLRTMGYKRTVAALNRWARSFASGAHEGGESEARLKRMARVVSVAGRRSLWPTSCLRQALCLWFLLARRGIVVEVRIGVDKPADGQFVAHAWVERQGQVLIGGDQVQERYAVLL